MSYPPPGGYGYPPQANYIPPQPVYCPSVPQNDTFVGYPPQPVFGNPSGPYNTSPAAMPYTQTGMPMAGGPQYDQPFSFAGTAYAASAALNFRQNYPPQAQTYLPQAQPYPQPTDYSAPQSPYPQQYSAPQSTYPQQYNYLEQSNNAQPLYPQQPTLTQQQPSYQQQQQPYTQQTNSVQQPQQTHFQTVPQTQASSAEIPKEPATQGTVKEFPCFKPQQDAEDLRKAMKGFGTDEKAVIQIIGTRSNTQRQKIKLEFATMFGKDLIKELISELSGNFQKTVLALLAPPDEFDASELYTSMKGVGTDEKALIEILCTRTNAQIRAASNAFKRLYKEDLEKWILSETSGHFRRLLVSLVQGSRNENDPLNHQKAVEDAQALYKAGEARWGTDESRFNVILASRSFPQLRLVFDEYQKISKKTLEIAIQKEMSGDLKDGMLAIVKCAQNKPKYFAERLYHSMKGLGTDDKTLIRIMVSRSEIDMVQIKAAFKSMYGKTLASFISDDCSGDYKKLLIQICGQ